MEPARAPSAPSAIDEIVAAFSRCDDDAGLLFEAADRASASARAAAQTPAPLAARGV